MGAIAQDVLGDPPGGLVAEKRAERGHELLPRLLAALPLLRIAQQPQQNRPQFVGRPGPRATAPVDQVLPVTQRKVDHVQDHGQAALDQGVAAQAAGMHDYHVGCRQGGVQGIFATGGKPHLGKLGRQLGVLGLCLHRMEPDDRLEGVLARGRAAKALCKPQAMLPIVDGRVQDDRLVRIQAHGGAGRGRGEVQLPRQAGQPAMTARSGATPAARNFSRSIFPQQNTVSASSG